MPNGGNPEECQRAAPYYEKIKADITNFAAKHGFEYIPWYHESPVFMMEWRDRSNGLTRSIQVCLNVRLGNTVTSSGEEIVVGVFAHAYSDTQGRRIKSFFVMNGLLPRDAGRVVSGLRAAVTLLGATREGDLLSAEEWHAKHPKLTPILSFL